VITNWSQPNSKYYPGNCLERLRDTTKILCLSTDRDLNPGHLEYEAGELTSRVRPGSMEGKKIKRTRKQRKNKRGRYKDAEIKITDKKPCRR
jgi:hypothetical protein